MGTKMCIFRFKHFFQLKFSPNSHKIGWIDVPAERCIVCRRVWLLLNLMNSTAFNPGIAPL